MLSRLQAAINRLLPFATPDTPLLQDLAHLGVICATLYYAPQIQAAFRQASRQANRGAPNDASHAHTDNEPAETDRRHDETHLANREAVNDRPRPPAPRVEDDDADSDAEHELQDGHGQFENDIPIGAAPQEQPGPAEPNPAYTSQQQRPVGAKKAKSLARRDQRRAYHEFMRSQGEAQRAADAEGEAERTAAMNAERERRAAAEAEISAREARAREDKKNRDRQEREQEMARRTSTVDMLRSELSRTRCIDLRAVVEKVGGGADMAWIQSLVKASGILGRNDQELVMVTENSFLVRVTKDEMQACYKAMLEQENMADDHGRISYGQMGDVLTGILRQKS